MPVSLKSVIMQISHKLSNVVSDSNFILKNKFKSSKPDKKSHVNNHII